MLSRFAKKKLRFPKVRVMNIEEKEAKGKKGFGAGGPTRE